MKVLFLDESGDHNLSVIDPQYPVFVLGGVIVDKDYAEGPLVEALNDFKQEFFGTGEIVLHTSDIVGNRNGFESLRDPDFRDRFYLKLNKSMRSLSYQVVACAIRKDRHLERYGELAINPYSLSLSLVVERFCFEVGNVQDGGMIVVEKRDPSLDRSLESAWHELRVRGTRYLKSNVINGRILSMNLRAKSENIAGLQLADLVVSPIGRHVLGKRDYEDWDVICEKLRRNHRDVAEGYGLVVLPK